MLTLPAQGVWVAMVTPMHPDESINFSELRNQINRFIDAGVDALFCLGTNGEFYALSLEEKTAVMEHTVAEVSGRVPVCFGVGCVTTKETIETARRAGGAGADAVSVITPHFVALSGEQIERHFRAVADSISLPVLLYNIPARTQNRIDVATVARLASVENIVAIKDSSGSLPGVQEFVRARQDDFKVFVGTDSLILEGLDAGACGAVSGLANVCPRLVVSIYAAWRDGRRDDAMQAQGRLSRVREILSRGNPNTVTKLAVNMIGQPVGPAREPASWMSPEDEDAVRQHLDAVLDRARDV